MNFYKMQCGWVHVILCISPLMEGELYSMCEY